MRFSLKNKIFIFGLFLTLAILGSVGTIGYKNGKVLRQQLYEINASIAHKNLDSAALAVWGLCETTHHVFQAELEQALQLFLSFSRETPPPFPQSLTDISSVELINGSLSNKERSWRPGHQTDLLHSLPELSLPLLNVEGKIFGQNSEIDHAFFEKIRLKKNIEISVFQRINVKGDMMRVATTLLDKTGKNAEGTYMPAFLDETRPHPIIDRILSQKPYDGRFLIFGTWYIAFYKPIVSQEGAVIGMLFIGMRTPALQVIEESIKKIDIGKEGAIWLLYAGNRPQTGEAGTWMIHNNNIIRGKNESSILRPYEYRDDRGVYFFREICEEVAHLGAKETRRRMITIAGHTPKETHFMRAHYAYFEPWDCIVGVQVEDNAALYGEDTAQEAFGTFFTKSLKSLGLSLFGLCVFMYLFLGRILKPLDWVHKACCEFSKKPLKDCNKKFKPRTLRRRGFLVFYDEFDDSLEQLQRLAQNLEKNGQTLDSTKREIQAVSETLGNRCNKQEIFLKTLQATQTALLGYIRTIGNQSGQLTQSAVNFQERLTNINRELEIKRLGADEIENILKTLGNSALALSTRISSVFEKANKLNRVITTINKIANQANLLAFNATIEADRSLDTGVDQGIVTEQIASFSNKTSAFSIDTEQIVNETKLSISAGIKEIDAFLKKTRNELDRMGQIFSNQEGFIKSFYGIDKQFFEIKNQVMYQAEQISGIVTEGKQLERSVMQTLSLIEDFYAINEKLGQIQIQVEEQHNNF